MKMKCLESDSLLMTQKHRMVKQKLISKMNPTFIKYKNQMAKRIAEIQHRNKRKDKISNEKDDKYYEEIYERNYYDVSIFGKDLDKFSNIYERMDEIKRCTGVTRPEMIRPVMEKNSSKIVKLIIRVNNYKDFKLLTASKEDMNSIRSTIYENASDLESIKSFVKDSSTMISQIRPQIENARENINNFKNSIN